MPADGCMRHEQLGSGIREALEPGSGFEGLEGIQRWQAASHVVTCDILLQVA